jgi:hypothetical protein
MLTQEDDVDIHALRKRGWSISAIARHVGRDRETVVVNRPGFDAHLPSWEGCPHGKQVLGFPLVVDIEGGLPGGGQLRGCSGGDYKKIIHGGVPG